MKRTITILTFVLLVCLPQWVRAQRAEVGMRAPYIHSVEWISDCPDSQGKYLLIQFFHSANHHCREGIELCNNLAREYRSVMDVVTLTREPAEQVAAMLLHQYQYCYVATDESGALFRAFETDHVPYALMVDPNGHIIWAGNPTRLTTTNIEKLLNL